MTLSNFETSFESSSSTEIIFNCCGGGGSPKPLIDHIVLPIFIHLVATSGIVGIRSFDITTISVETWGRDDEVVSSVRTLFCVSFKFIISGSSLF